MYALPWPGGPSLPHPAPIPTSRQAQRPRTKTRLLGRVWPGCGAGTKLSGSVQCNGSGISPALPPVGRREGQGTVRVQAVNEESPWRAGSWLRAEQAGGEAT